MSGCTSGLPVLVKLWRCPACGEILNGQTINIDEGRAKCSKKWHKASAVGQEFIAARSVVDTTEAIDAAVDALGQVGAGMARSTVRFALLEAMRAAAKA